MVTGVKTDGELFELESCFEFRVERGCHRAVVAVAHDGVIVFIGVVKDDVVRGEVDVHHVETDTHGRNQVEECVFAQGLPTEHPFGTVGEPAGVIERGRNRVAACVRGDHVGLWTFRGLRNHEVEVYPSQELLVLGTDIEVESGIELVELFVIVLCGPVEKRCIGPGWRLERAGRERDIIDIVVESGHHAAEVSTEGNETTDVVLVVKTFVGCGRIGSKCENTKHRCHDQRGYFCLHKDSLLVGISESNIMSNNKIHYLPVLCMHFCYKSLKINKLGTFWNPFRGLWFDFFAKLLRFGHREVPFWGFCAILLCVFSIAGCNRSEPETGNVSKCGEAVQFENVGSSYFSIGKLCGADVAVLRSVVGKDTLVHKFVMMDSANWALGTDLRRRGFPEEWLSAAVLHVPLTRVAALSTSQVGFMLRLGLRDKIVGVSDGQYIVDSVLYYRTKRDSCKASEFVESIGYDAGALEKLMALKPDLVLDFTTGGDYDNYEQIARTSLPLMLTSEWQENSPLAKLEWIKLYGILFGVRPLADSIYEQEKNAYESLRNLIAQGSMDSIASARLQNDSAKFLSSLVSRLSSERCPRVLAGMTYGGVWHASGGNSFTANLIRDAGGCYLWASDTSRELTFSFEQVYALADSVDVWVNPSMFATADEIVALEPRVKNIKAFRDKKVFQNDGRKGPYAGNDFYEGAITRPAELLWNLAKCINGTVPGVNSLDTNYKWYRNIYNF